jgi:hypothetical protein
MPKVGQGCDASSMNDSQNSHWCASAESFRDWIPPGPELRICTGGFFAEAAKRDQRGSPFTFGSPVRANWVQ